MLWMNYFQFFYRKLGKNVFVMSQFKLSCNSRFQRVFTACVCDFKVVTLVGSSQCNYFKTQQHAINARWKRLSQLSFTLWTCNANFLSFLRWRKYIEQFKIFRDLQLHVIDCLTDCQPCLNGLIFKKTYSMQSIYKLQGLKMYKYNNTSINFYPKFWNNKPIIDKSCYQN